MKICEVCKLILSTFNLQNSNPQHSNISKKTLSHLVKLAKCLLLQTIENLRKALYLIKLGVSHESILSCLTSYGDYWVGR